MNLEKVTVARADGQGQVGHFRSPSADTYLQLNVNVELNRTYTLHGYIKSAENGTLSCLGKSVGTTTSWNHFSMQIVPDSKIFSLVFSPGEYWFYNFKLEKGTIMTQWTPNGEDLVVVKQNIVSMGSSINQLNDKITQKVWMTEVNAAKGEVNAHLTNVEQTAKKIDWLVKSGTDSSNMVLTDNAYSLIAKNIDLTGKVKFSSFDSTTQSRLTPLKPMRTWTSKFTTIGITATCNLSDFNRTPVVGDIFSNTDGGSNIGTWQVTVVNGNSVTIKLLSCDAPAKSAADAASEAAKKAKAISDNIYSTNTTTINGGKITTGSITASQIAAGAITSEKIAPKTITAEKIAADAITAEKISSGAITADKIATDAIKSKNYIANTSGSYLNLADGSYDSKNLKWDSQGNVTMEGGTITGAYGEFTKAFNVDVVNPSTGLNQSFWAQDAETGTKISGNYSGNNVDNNLTVNAEGANLFSNVGGHTSGVGCGGGYASVSGEAVNISGTNVDITANNLTLNGVETVFGSKTYWDNSTWHWRQWTDGFLELWGNAKVTISTADKYGNLFFTSGYVYLPSGVTAIVGTTASVYSQGGLFFVNFTNWSSTKLDFYISSANIETNKTVWLQFYVLGRWK